MANFKRFAARTAAFLSVASTVFSNISGTPAYADSPAGDKPEASTTATVPTKFSNNDYTQIADCKDAETFKIISGIFRDLVFSDMRGVRVGDSMPDYSFLNQSGTDPQVVKDFKRYPAITASVAFSTHVARWDLVTKVQETEASLEFNSLAPTGSVDHRRDVFSGMLTPEKLNEMLRKGTTPLRYTDGTSEVLPTLEVIKNTANGFASEAKSKSISVTDELALRVKNNYAKEKDDWRLPLTKGLLLATGTKVIVALQP